MSTSVKHISSTQRGAPTLNGTAGTLIAVLDALFVSGWGPTTALSVSVSGGIATAQLNSGETFDPHAAILVAGGTPSALNGESRVLTSSLTSITWATTAPDGVATGAITIKYAPQTSWAKVYGATNKAVYKSNHVQSNGRYFRIVDTGDITARVIGYNSMSDVDTGLDPFPTELQMAGGGHIRKSTNANPTAVRYRIFCDERAVLFCIVPSSTASYESTAVRGFGEGIALSPSGDTWGSFLSFNGTNDNPINNGSLDAGSQSSISASGGGLVCERAITGLGGSVVCKPMSFTGGAATISGNNSTAGTLGALPSAVDGRVYTSRIYIREDGDTNPPRIVVPGLHYIPQSNGYASLGGGNTMDGAGGLAGRKLLTVPVSSFSEQVPQGVILVDLTGPWR